jgi:hypothetical protein
VDAFFDDAPPKQHQAKKKPKRTFKWKGEKTEESSDKEEEEEEKEEGCVDHLLPVFQQPAAVFLTLMFEVLPQGGRTFSSQDLDSDPVPTAELLSQKLEEWTELTRDVPLLVASPREWAAAFPALAVHAWGAYLEGPSIADHVRSLAAAATAVVAGMSNCGNKGWRGWGEQWAISPPPPTTTTTPAPKKAKGPVLWPSGARPLLERLHSREADSVEASPWTRTLFESMLEGISSMQAERETSNDAPLSDEEAGWAADRLCASAFANWIWFQHDLAFSASVDGTWKMPLLARSQARLLVAQRLWRTALFVLEEQYYRTRDAHEGEGMSRSLLGKFTASLRWRRRPAVTTSADQEAATKGNRVALGVWGPALEQVLRGTKGMLEQTQLAQEGTNDLLRRYTSLQGANSVHVTLGQLPRTMG